MNSRDMEAQIEKLGLVPVVVLNDAKDAKPLAKALCDGGLPCAEVTFRTDAAEESIRQMTQDFPQMLVGAGTVLTVEQVNRAVNAGAKFIVSPGFDPAIVDYCLNREIPVFPGCVTPSEVAQAVKRSAGGEVFPGQAVWGSSHHQSTRGSLCGTSLYAHRRSQRFQSEGIPGVSLHCSLRRKLDGKGRSDSGRRLR